MKSRWKATRVEKPPAARQRQRNKPRARSEEAQPRNPSEVLVAAVGDPGALRFSAVVGRYLPIGHSRSSTRSSPSAMGDRSGTVLEDLSSTCKMNLPLKILPGNPSCLGVSEVENGINFAIFSENASSVTLCLSTSERSGREDLDDGMIEICLNPSKNRTGNIWHITVEIHMPNPSMDEEYLVIPKGDFRSSLELMTSTAHPFDWGSDYKLPNIREMNQVAWNPKIRGSYLGVIEKIPHLVDLGINAVELLPIFEFDELELQRRPNPRDHMVNTWGYSTINFFTPMSRYASAGGGTLSACREFKEMVKALHNAGIEVILDVVYNHTNESDDAHPYTTSFRGIDNKVYYMVDLGNGGQLLNFSGCGNTFNCNHPVVMELILDSLRYWVTEYHVDGFRFDLASILCRDTDGSPLSAPPIIRAIAKDPVLSRCKLISEPWDCGGLYLVGKFPNWDRWAEWNGKYRDDIRSFIKGDYGMKGSFATRVSGSSDLYQINKRKPWHSVNFVTAHDGFTLCDLVSYNFKHNKANGENGNDGSNDNFSWNCGYEGETADASINSLRVRQMKNFHLALMVSQGMPMMVMGDEYGHTRFGNNNSYGHDNALNNVQWNQLESKKSNHFRFFSETIKFRLKHSILRQKEFLHKSDISWHEDNWDNPESKFLAFTLHDKKFGGDIYLAFNAHNYFVKVGIPSAPHGKRWHRVVDTNLNSPDDFLPEGIPFNGSSYNVAPYSSILLEAKP